MFHIKIGDIKNKSFKKKQLSFNKKLIPWIVLGISIFATILVWIVIVELERQNEQTEFNGNINRIQIAIENKLSQYNVLISGTRGLFAASALVEPEEWSKFITVQNISEKFPEILGIGFIMDIDSEEDAASLIQFMNNHGVMDYQIKPEGKRDEYHPIVYLEPQNDRNKFAIGYDIHTEPTRRHAEEIAEATGENTITGKITLVQETDKDTQFGFLMLQPIYENGKSTLTEAERKENIFGFGYGAFRMNDFINIAVDNVFEDHMELKIYDGKDEPQNLLFSRVSDTLNPRVNFKTTTLLFGQHTWTLVFQSTDPDSLDDILIQFITLGVGFSMSGLLFVVFHFMIMRQEIDKQKDDFSNMINHELKTPLVPIITYCKMFKKSMFGKTDKEQTDAITVIEKNAKRLDSIISDIIDMRKIVAKQIKFEINDLSLDEFFSEIESDYEKLLENDCQITYLCEKNLSIKADKSRLRQVYDKLLDNAISFTTKNDRKIEIGCKKEDKEIIFYIKDNGSGITKDKQDNLFKKYTQENMGITRKHGGIGLSLAICKGIIDGMGGRIWIESKQGEGTSVYFTLPKNN